MAGILNHGLHPKAILSTGLNPEWTAVCFRQVPDSRLPEFYPAFREGIFNGVITSKNTNEGITKYELKLPTDIMFSKVYEDLILHYTVYENQNIVMLDTITPEDILTEGHQKELTTYKGVPISKSHAEKDMFKINLLNMLEK